MMKNILAILILTPVYIFASSSIQYSNFDQINLNPVKHISKGKYKEYENYVLYLTPFNTILPNDERVKKNTDSDNYRNDILDEKSVQFKYGQFSVYFESKKFPILKDCSNYVELRMPQTLFNVESNKDLKAHEHILEKQSLFFNIKNMVETNNGIQRVIVEPYSGCNAFFRAANGQYINYEGQLR